MSLLPMKSGQLNMLGKKVITQLPPAKEDCLHADETTLQVLSEPNRPATSKSYMWLYRTGRTGPPIILYDYQKTRAAKHPRQFLSDFQGYLHVEYGDRFSPVMRYFRPLSAKASSIECESNGPHEYSYELFHNQDRVQK